MSIKLNLNLKNQTIYFIVGLIYSLGSINNAVNGQSFIELTSNNYGIYSGDLIMADLDNNDTLDLILIGVDTLGLDILRIFEMDVEGNLSLAKEIVIPPIRNPKIQVSDLNNNGYIDLLIRGVIDDKPYFNVLLNKTNFEFESIATQLPQLNGELLINDFTNNGYLDFILSGNTLGSTDIVEFYFNNEGTFVLCDTCNTLPLKNIRAMSMDVSNSGFTDFILAGLNEAGSQKFDLYKNVNNRGFNTTELPFVEFQNPVFAKGDFTQTGFMDIIIGGKINQTDTLIIYSNTGSVFEIAGGIKLNGNVTEIITADLTNDGLLDILVLAGEEVTLYYDSGLNSYDSEVLIPSISKGSIAIGDFDRDNDQDIIITGLNASSNNLQILKNDYLQNIPPQNPDLLFSFPRGDSVKLEWNKGSDNSTLPGSLTYNVFLTDSVSSVLPVHSSIHRSLTDYGLQFQSNEVILKDLMPGMYEWAVQSVDNSLVAPTYLGSGGGSGGGGSGSCRWVFEIKDTDDPTQKVCIGDTVVLALSPPTPVQWYSDNNGELSFSDTLIYIASEDDVLFANYINEECDTETFATYVEILSVENLDLSNQEICLGENISFDISDLFADAIWYFQSQEDDSIKGTSITIFPDQSDSLTVEATSESGCTLKKTIYVKVNELPDINAGDDVEIYKGESVSLQATGGISYVWSPSTWLDNPLVPNPTSSPKRTITYSVVGSDAANCTNQDEVVVLVKMSVFVPNLFSPNNDGHNDTFHVFGNDVKSILLKIYDAQGKLLFESSNISGAMNIGWDGTFNGHPMPQGKYFWAILGEFIDGTEISNDGKISGTVTLIR